MERCTEHTQICYHYQNNCFAQLVHALNNRNIYGITDVSVDVIQ